MSRNTPKRLPVLENSDPVDISGLTKAEVLVALFTNAGLVRWTSCWNWLYDYLPIGDALNLLERRTTFYTLRGRHLHVDLAESTFDPTVYDYYLNAPGAAQLVVSHLRETGTTLQPTPGLSRLVR